MVNDPVSGLWQRSFSSLTATQESVGFRIFEALGRKRPVVVFLVRRTSVSDIHITGK